MIEDKEKILNWVKEDYIFFPSEKNLYESLVKIEKDIKNRKNLQEDQKEKEKKYDILPVLEKSKEIVSPDGIIKLFPIPFSPDGDGYNDILDINLIVTHPDQVKEWRLDIFDPQNHIFKSFKGDKVPPRVINWDGNSESGELVQSTANYKVIFYLIPKNGKTKTYKVVLPIDILIEKKGLKLFIRVSSIIFPGNSSDFNALRQSAKSSNNKALDKIANALKRFPNYSITVEGHANLINWNNKKEAEREQKEELMPLSIERAEVVKKSLIERGIPSSQIKAKRIGRS